MAYLKFNKAELVNLEYSLKREILSANPYGAYCNTSIVSCNTRKYHGLLVCPIHEGRVDEKYVLLSALDEAIGLNGKQFNLGIHCYGDVYEPKGHKYVADFSVDPVPQVTYKVGPVVLEKSVVMSQDKPQVLFRYKVAAAPAKITLSLKPFLAFRDVHALTKENSAASTLFREVAGGVEYRMYDGFPALDIQCSRKPSYHHLPYWYKGITYSNEYRRGYDCVEDLLVPGALSVDLAEGDELIVSACAGAEQTPSSLKAAFKKACAAVRPSDTHRNILLNNVDLLTTYKEGRKMICAGYSWLKTGLLRESINSLTGFTLYAGGSGKDFEELLDNLVATEQERLFHRTTQIEAPLALTDAIQQYIAFGADEKAVWEKYGDTLRRIVESYASREEATLCPNGLLWCEKDGVALSWMNTYMKGWPVNERAGFQVETNALWYNALCFALEMETKYGKAKGAFVKKWTPIRNLVKENYQKTFLVSHRDRYFLADYVDNCGQHTECRPNMLWAAYIPYPLVDEEVQADILAKITGELVTRRGIRSLSPRSEEYRSLYDGSQDERDFAYHNGSTHPFLLGPYEDLCFRMTGQSFCGRAKWLTEGLYEDINTHGVGSFCELYDADPPHEPHGAIASAWTTAALNRCQYLLEKYSESEDKK